VQRFAAGTATFRSDAYGAEAASVEQSRRARSGFRHVFVTSARCDVTGLLPISRARNIRCSPAGSPLSGTELVGYRLY